MKRNNIASPAYLTPKKYRDAENLRIGQNNLVDFYNQLISKEKDELRKQSLIMEGEIKVQQLKEQFDIDRSLGESKLDPRDSEITKGLIDTYLNMKIQSDFLKEVFSKPESENLNHK